MAKRNVTARVEEQQLARVRRYLKTRTPSETVRAALDFVAEQAAARPANSTGTVSPAQPRAVRFVDKQKLQHLIDTTFAEMGMRGAAVGAEKVQEMMAACGVKPEENMFSREIIAMREE